MKRFFTFLAAIVVVVGLSAQAVDYEIIGFADANGVVLPSSILTAEQDFQPRVILQNNGPAVPAATDSIKFIVTYNEAYLTEIRLLGSQLQRLTAGEQVVVDLARPIWTAAEMDMYQLTAAVICFEVLIVGAATDPVSDNNTACTTLTRPLAIGELGVAQPQLFPNPATNRVTLGEVEGARVQFFDLRGKCVATVECAERSQLVDISMLAAGMYIVRFATRGGVLSQKLNVVR